MKKFRVLALAAITNILAALPTLALDLAFKVEPMMLFPSGEHMKIAPGGVVFAGVDLFNIMTVGLEGGYLSEKPENTDEGINTFFGGINAGAYYYPLSRLYLGAAASFGFVGYTTQITSETESFSSIYYKAAGEVGFRVTPIFSINAAGGWASFCSGKGSNFITGPFAALSMRFSATTVGSAQKAAVYIKIEQDSDVFPVYSAVYGYEPFGTIILRNNDGAELRDVHVSFRAGKYTFGAKECGYRNKIERHSRVEFPLCADFSNEILSLTENGKISGEVVIEYEFLGKKMTVIEPVIISVNNRNAFQWGDNASLAAFISPDSQEVAAFAKEVAGITRNNIYTGMNAPLQYAAGMVEAIRLVGIGYSGDKITPYSKAHLSDKLDSIQYPLQTLQYLSGDYDDLGILLCSCLQTVNVATGFMPLDDDFIVLVKLGIRQRNISTNFADEKNLVIDTENDEVYLPLSMANIEKGFTASYKAGAALAAKCLSDEENYYEFFDTMDAWTNYKPVAYSNSFSAIKIRQDSLLANFRAAIQNYMTSDIEPVIARARASGDPNKLGVALVRAGRYAEAQKEFQKLSTTAAMNNTANILMIEKNYAAASAMYKKVLAKEPENRAAQRGLENANAKLE